MRGLVALSALSMAFMGACADHRAPGTIGYVDGFSGLVAADEPQAVLVARDVLSSGGSAGDAAVALGFSLAVTYPVAAGLGGGGVCIAYDSKENTTEVLDFRATNSGGAAVPALARGLYALHARTGSMRWESLLIPAENMARFGFPVSRALYQRLADMPPVVASGGEGSAYAGLRSAGEGQTVTFHDLASSIGAVRQRGAGVLHEGPTAREIVQGVGEQGYAMTAESLRSQLPAWSPSTGAPQGVHRLHRVSRGGVSPGGPSASTGFVVADRYGSAVACVLGMGTAYGTGKVMPGLGFLIAPGGADVAGDAALMVNENSKEFRLGVAAGGAGATPLVSGVIAGSVDKNLTPSSALQSAVAGIGTGGALANVVSCPDGIPPNPGTCAAASDPRGAGYAVKSGL